MASTSHIPVGSAQAEDSVIVIERLVRATPQNLFDCFTKPQLLERWWAARSDACVSCDLTPIAGGRFRISFVTRERVQRVTTGEYLQVISPSLLEFTWRWGEPDSGASTSRVQISIEPHGERSKLILHHFKLPSNTERDQHEAGWTASLDFLQKQLEGRLNNDFGECQ